MSQALYRKWRPKTWDEVIGQQHVVQTLRNAVRGDRVAHAYLFAGPRGTGKTTTARLLAKAVNCLAEEPADRPCNQCANCQAVNEGRFLDLIEIDAASNTSVEDVRDLRDKISFSPNEGRFKIYIVDEVHMLSTAAFNALLKTLEEPPSHAIFILATTEVHKIPPTVLSRCQRHEFRRLPVNLISGYLREQVAAEAYEIEPEAVELIARQATGSLRDAVSMLDQLVSTGRPVSLEDAQSILGTAAGEAVRHLVTAWVEGEATRGLQILNEALDAGADPRQFARQVVDLLRAMLMIRVGNADLVEAGVVDGEELKRQAEKTGMARLLAGLEAFSKAAREGRANWQPGLPMELAFLESLTETGRASAPGGEPTEASAGGAAENAGPARKMREPDPTPLHDSGSEEKRARPQRANAAEGFQALLDRWEDILAAVYSRDPRAQALLRSGQPLDLQKGQLVIGFASDILREKMEKGDNLALAGQALEEVLGEPMTVRCVLEGAWQGGKKQAAPPVVEDGGMVATAMRELGAHVAEVKSDPPEALAESGDEEPDD